MYRIMVVSSDLASVGYDMATKILEIEFHDGSVYDYFDVPAQIHNELMSAPSKGGYFHRNIKNRFGYQRVN